MLKSKQIIEIRPYRFGEVRPRLAIENLTREEIRDITRSINSGKVISGAMSQKNNRLSDGTFKKEAD